MIGLTTICGSWGRELEAVVVGVFARPLLLEVGSVNLMNVMSLVVEAVQVAAFVYYYCGQPRPDMVGRDLVVD